MPVAPERFIPPLPDGIPIVPVKAKAPKAKRRLPIRRIVFLLLLAGIGGLIWFRSWYVPHYDEQRMDPVVQQALVERAPKGTRLAVTLWSGPRILELESTRVYYPNKVQLARGGRVVTCGLVKVIDSATELGDPKYRGGYWACAGGFAYAIR